MATAELAKVVVYSEVKIVIEDEEFEVNATELNFDNRVKLLLLIEAERHTEFKRIFNSLDKNPTIKEFRENFDYVKTLTELYKLFKDESNIYFSTSKFPFNKE